MEKKKDSFASGGTKYRLKRNPPRNDITWSRSMVFSCHRSIFAFCETNFLTVVAPANYQVTFTRTFILQDGAFVYDSLIAFTTRSVSSSAISFTIVRYRLDEDSIVSLADHLHAGLRGIFHDNSSLRKVRRLLTARSRLLSSAAMVINRLLIPHTHRSILRSCTIILSCI